MKQNITVALPTRPYRELTITEDKRVCSVCSGALPCHHEPELKAFVAQTETTAPVLHLNDYITRPFQKLQTR